MRAIRDQVPDAIVGVGTLLDRAQIAPAVEAGAVFAVSPGLDVELVAPVTAAGLAYLPGIQTVSEAMAARKAGSTGRIWSTGGIGAADAPEYLRLPNVLCVGGSFPAPTDAIRDGDWARIEELARQAAVLRG